MTVLEPNTSYRETTRALRRVNALITYLVVVLVCACVLFPNLAQANPELANEDSATGNEAISSLSDTTPPMQNLDGAQDCDCDNPHYSQQWVRVIDYGVRVDDLQQQVSDLQAELNAFQLDVTR